MNDNKIKSIIKLDNKERYDYSIREFVKLEKIWAVSIPDHWITIVDNVKDEIFPIWPHKEVAKVCILNEMKIDSFYIQSIEYQKFKEFCIPDMNDKGILFGVFYNDKREGIAVEGKALLKDLELEEEGEF
jgi:hypothetical protein